MIKLLVLIDCIVNWLLFGDITETMSARAHRMRMKPQPYWWWLAGAIDTIFFWQPEHCRTAYEQEQVPGGALPWMPAWLLRPIF